MDSMIVLFNSDGGDAKGKVSPFPSGERLSKDSVLFGRQCSNVYNKYQLDPRIIDTGLHGSVQRCEDRSTGKKYADKSICKDNLDIKPDRLLPEVALLQEMRHTSIIRLIKVIKDEDYIHLLSPSLQCNQFGLSWMHDDSVDLPMSSFAGTPYYITSSGGAPEEIL
ncbi:hypothetical protein ACHAW5_002438 [Stephanodiscus triporus]|uniref:Protein kinase domain-containing protein n=1 Tax=Stephanodiscus triporus TaxID=2934178 RepID=A0ABD3QRM1_9STRA